MLLVWVAEDIEEPVASASDDGEELAENAAQALALLRPLRKERRSTHDRLPRKTARIKKHRVAGRQLAAQIHTYNRQGHARTKDYNMQPKGRLVSKQKGNGVEEVDHTSDLEGRVFGPHRNKPVIDNPLGKPHGDFA